eukprot:CAMPEP_0183379806 /NCGR_PEP_ID=MMETSP0164_2-20130417/125611_1 /TAXON_ID=221442 /ORGANISM="Coccolithus pelagicus ssp braarudi, Strain PLY182g" /LENGTH=82 /DNA_ID=CAMNT_0025557391 /DNA_START=417 /DNA_END=665 /DNA_ORIENTATION=+
MSGGYDCVSRVDVHDGGRLQDECEGPVPAKVGHAVAGVEPMAAHRRSFKSEASFRECGPAWAPVTVGLLPGGEISAVQTRCK